MDALKNKNVGYAIAAVGALLALVGAFADTLGIGAEDAEGMGGKQLALLLAGVVLAGVGLAVVFLAGQAEPETEPEEASVETEADTAEATD